MVFNIPSWEQRIYVYEPGLYLRPRFPSVSGVGQKFTLAIRVSCWKHVVLEGLWTRVVTDPKRQTQDQAGFQIRWKF
jgi:hypothetical protein